jgi:hypothetical protein
VVKQPFFERYFRMSAVSGVDAESNTISMLCDVHKCNYRYAFFLYQEEHNLPIGKSGSSSEFT